MSKQEKFYDILYDSHDCMNPRCRFIYTEYEVRGVDFQNYFQSHRNANSRLELYPFVNKVWKIDDVLNAKQILGWTLHFNLKVNGFEQVHEIDLCELFDGFKRKKDEQGNLSRPWHPPIEHNLEEKRKEMEEILESLNYRNRKLIVFRTTRYGLVSWDSIYLFSIGRYHSQKKKLREKISKYWLESQKKDETKNKQGVTEGKAKEIIKPDWETAKKRLEKFLKEKNPKVFLYDPAANKGYVLD